MDGNLTAGGQGMQVLGNAIGSVAGGVFRQERYAQQLAQALEGKSILSDLYNKTSRATLDMPYDPQNPGVYKKTVDDTAAQAKKYIDSIQDPVVKQHLMANDYHLRTAANNHVDTLTYARNKEWQQRTVLKSKQTFEQDTINAVPNQIDGETLPVAWDRKMREFTTTIDQAAKTGILTAEQADAAHRDYLKQVAVGLIQKDPQQAGLYMESYRPYFEPTVYGQLKGVLDRADADRTGMFVGVEIFKTDKTGSIEAMTDAVRAKNLSPEATKVAIAQVKELYNERKIDDDNRKKAVFDDAYAVLTKTSLAGGGRLNRLSDIPSRQWNEMMAIDPKTTMQIQEQISREQRQQANINKAEVRAAKQEQRLQQADNESAIIISDDFQTRDLKKELALGNISPAQYRSLTVMQEKLDPIKRFSVNSALSKVTSGTAIDKALGVKGNDAAMWKLKYGDLIKAWAYKNADDPNFDDNLTKYVERYVLSDMVESWLATDETDRMKKYEDAKAISGELPQRRKTDNKQPISREEAIAELKRRGKI